MQKFKLAAVQMNALKDNLAHNLAVHARFTEQAAAAGCRLVMFPELSASAHFGAEDVVRYAESLPGGQICQHMLELSRRHRILVAYGFCESAHGTHYNTHALVGTEGVIGIQRKVHASNNEYFSFRMGRSFEVYDLGFCQIGTLVCFDAQFSESWRVLALKGAEVILLPHASRSGWGEAVPPERQLEDMRRRYAALPGDFGTYAKENAVFAAFGNQVDYNGHSTHAGGAYILGPRHNALGTQVLAALEPTLEDSLVSAELDPELLESARRSSNFTLKVRRPEVYGEITRLI
jgi:predicted amidohydrolase